MRKTYKKVISLCAVLFFALALIPVPGLALGDPFSAIAIGGLSGVSGAGLFSSMASVSGFNITYNSSYTSDPCDALWNSLNPDHVYFSGSKGQETVTDPQTGIPTVYDYITVDIGDWLDAQTDFIDEFVSTYNVTDNSSGSVSSPRSYKGYPFKYGSVIPYGDPIGICNDPSSFSYSDILVTYDRSNGSPYLRIYQSGVMIGSSNPVSSFTGTTVSLGYYDGKLCLVNFGNGSRVTTTAINDTTPEKSFPWTSGTLNTGVFDGYSAAKLKIPASSWSPSDPVNWTVQELLEELTNKWINGDQSDIIIEDEEPGPFPPVPVPSTPLGDIPTDEWYDLFGLPVLEGQEEIHQDLQDFSDNVSDGIDDVIGELEDIESDVESIDTNIGVGNGLLGDIKSLGQTISNTLSNIASGVSDIVQEIVLSTETFIAGLLNSIMVGLGGWLSTMREAFSIWHYVVEWVGSISTVFSWFWSVAGSTSYYIQLPIYASLAGAVVLAFYKRFGK